jgi:hypothetical protein
MAKLSANGCHEIGKVTVKRGPGRYVFALRSDGKVLSRLAGFYNEDGEYTAHPIGYSVAFSFRESRSFTKDDVATLTAMLVQRGYEVLA